MKNSPHIFGFLARVGSVGRVVEARQSRWDHTDVDVDKTMIVGMRDIWSNYLNLLIESDTVTIVIDNQKYDHILYVMIIITYYIIDIVDLI